MEVFRGRSGMPVVEIGVMEIGVRRHFLTGSFINFQGLGQFER